MKHYISLFAVLGVTLFTGCSTTGGGGGSFITPARVRAVAYLGTTVTLQSHPQYRMGFTIAADNLKVLGEQEQIDFATLVAIVQQLPIKQLKGNNAVLLFTATTLLFSDLGTSIDMSKVENVRPYVKALEDGIRLGLGQTTTPTTIMPPVEVVPIANLPVAPLILIP